jgi:hypothetical protein
LTTEIVVMNREAVALAADSAVTVSNWKIYDSANKIFMPSSLHSIGIMIYNSTSFVGVPWDILISDFGKFIKNENSCKKLSEYVTVFESWLSEKLNVYCNDENIGGFLHFIVDEIIKKIGIEIYNDIQDFVLKESRKIQEDEVIEISKGILNKLHNEYKNRECYFDEQDIDEITKFVLVENKNLVDEIYQHYLKFLPFGEMEKTKINEILIYGLINETDPDFSIHTGLVFAGYGDEDLFPSCITLRIDGVVGCKIKKKIEKNECGAISVNNVAAIIPLAQKSIINNMLFGIHPQLNEVLFKKLATLLSKEQVKDVATTMTHEFLEEHKSSIMEAVNSLPIDQLAFIAESFVGLTSMMKRFSMEPNTVGGPTDVAVISRTEGFIWIKKKQYFDNTQNLHFRYNQ